MSANPYVEIADKKAYQRAYYLRNKERLNKKNKENRLANLENYRANKRKYEKEHRAEAEERHVKWRSNKSNMAKVNKQAVRWRKTNPDKFKVIKRKAVLKANYGMTPEKFDSMASSQGFACAICRIVPTHTLHVDHDHKTGRVRGLLCRTCNTGLGLLKDNAEFLSNAIKYLSI